MGKKKIVTTPGDTPAADQKSEASVAKKSSKKSVINGIAYINVSYNNILVSIADSKGDTLAWTTSGSMGFKGSKKSTPYAANIVAKECSEKVKKFNMMNVKIVVKGIGPGREAAMRGIAGSGLNITSIVDATPVAHNGVRSPKPRRV